MNQPMYRIAVMPPMQRIVDAIEDALAHMASGQPGTDELTFALRVARDQSAMKMHDGLGGDVTRCGNVEESAAALAGRMMSEYTDSLDVYCHGDIRELIESHKAMLAGAVTTVTTGDSTDFMEACLDELNLSFNPRDIDSGDAVAMLVASAMDWDALAEMIVDATYSEQE
jgi:hypothetical protein